MTQDSTATLYLAANAYTSAATDAQNSFTDAFVDVELDDLTTGGLPVGPNWSGTLYASSGDGSPSQIESGDGSPSPSSITIQLYLPAGDYQMFAYTTVGAEANNPISSYEGAFAEAYLSDIQAVVPEPATLIIWSLLGGLGITIGRRCKRKAA